MFEPPATPNRAASVAPRSPVNGIIVQRPSRQRSATTNDPLSARTDRNTARGRRIVDLYRAYAEALGHPTDTIARANILTAAELKVAAEDARKQLLDGAGDADQLIRLENLAHRAERKLGVTGSRNPRDAGPALADIIAEHERGAA